MSPSSYPFASAILYFRPLLSSMIVLITEEIWDDFGGALFERSRSDHLCRWFPKIKWQRTTNPLATVYHPLRIEEL
jgi:hypothetical protein